MSSADRHRLRRKLDELEAALLLGGGAAAPGEAEVRAALDPLVAATGEQAATDRAAALAEVAAGRRPRAAYIEQHDACGVRRVVSAGGRVIYMMPVETFPDHVNNVYLVKDGQRKFLFDAGT